MLVGLRKNTSWKEVVTRVACWDPQVGELIKRATIPRGWHCSGCIYFTSCIAMFATVCSPSSAPSSVRSPSPHAMASIWNASQPDCMNGWNPTTAPRLLTSRRCTGCPWRETCLSPCTGNTRTLWPQQVKQLPVINCCFVRRRRFLILRGTIVNRTKYCE